MRARISLTLAASVVAAVTSLAATTGVSPATAGAGAADEPFGAAARTITTTTTTGTTAGEYLQVGYFTQWGIYRRNFLVKDVHTSGMASLLTHIHYAFANVNSDGRCFEINEAGQGDAWADYQKRFKANQSVDGVGDVFTQPLAGNFNQLRKLKQMYPHLRVHLSIGGWTWSRFFSDAALTPESREAFVASCVDLFIEGNLPILDDAPHGGPGSAFGVFDGIDLDWEWPASEGNPHNVVRPEDRENYTALAAEFRRQLDLAGAAHGRHYALTAFLPADPAKIAAGIEIGPLFDSLDFATIQGYDLHGPWDPTTNHQSQLFSPPADPDPNRFSVDLAVQAYLTGGAPPGKVVVGIPYYGRGWTGVTNAGDGLYQGAGGPARGTFEDGVEDYKKLVTKKGNRFYDPVAGAHWLFDGRNFWSYDNLEVIAQKTAYVRAGGLGGTMVWSLDADTANAELTTAINDGLGAATLPAMSPR